MESQEYKAMYEAEDNHFWYKGMRKISKALIDMYLPEKKRNIILDAGCGTGGSFSLLSEYGSTHGVDFSEDAVRYCKKRGLKNIKKGSINKLPYKNSTFDLVTSFDVLYHKGVTNDSQALNEFYRVLKPGGILLIRVPAYNWLYSYHDKLVHTKHRYTKNEMVSLLTESKFVILKGTYVNFFLFPLIFLKRFLFRSKNNLSDVTPLPLFLNTLYYIFFAVESYIIRITSFPFGLSVVITAKKM